MRGENDDVNISFASLSPTRQAVTASWTNTSIFSTRSAWRPSSVDPTGTYCACRRWPWTYAPAATSFHAQARVMAAGVRDGGGHEYTCCMPTYQHLSTTCHHHLPVGSLEEPPMELVPCRPRRDATHHGGRASGRVKRWYGTCTRSAQR